jgi:serine O-acetyltransferase
MFHGDRRQLNIPEKMGDALVASIRDFRVHRARRDVLSKIFAKYAHARHLVWSILTGSDIHPYASLGEGVRLPHPNGIVIHAEAVVGDRCMIMQQVTIGQLSEDHAPTIGNGVYIGAGAKILGNITIGDRARIGANAVVLIDVPADWTAVGVPATISPTLKMSSTSSQ